MEYQPNKQSYEELKSEILSETESTDEKDVKEHAQPDNKVDNDKQSVPLKKEETKKKITEDKPATTTKVATKPKEVVIKKPIEKPKVVPAKPKPPAKNIVQAEKIIKPKPKPKPKPVTPAPKPAIVAKQASKPIATPPPSTDESPEESITFNMEPPDIEDEESSSGIAPPTQVVTANVASDRSAEENKNAFSVQVGLFTNKDYAQNFVDDLIDKGFAAYMEDFKAKDGVTKYNVRFGRFADREQVQARLAEYKKVFSTPAYVVINK